MTHEGLSLFLFIHLQGVEDLQRGTQEWGRGAEQGSPFPGKWPARLSCRLQGSLFPANETCHLSRCLCPAKQRMGLPFCAPAWDPETSLGSLNTALPPSPGLSHPHLCMAG